MKLIQLFTALALLIASGESFAAKRHHSHRSARHRHHRVHRPAPNPYTSEECPNGEFAKRMRLTAYYTPVVTSAKCDNGKFGLLNYSSKERSGSVCSQSTIDYVVKRMEGAGTIVSPYSEHLGVLISPKGPLQEILNAGFRFSEIPPNGTPEGMSHLASPVCPLGFGNKIDGKPICLDPFRTIACPPHHPMGEVAFIPAAVGIKYPRYPGELKDDYDLREGHDGYFVCGDIGSAIQGEHVDMFTAFINPYDAANPFKKFGSTTQFGICWVSKDKDPERRFKFHTATEVNPRFPWLDKNTYEYYTNQLTYADAFGLVYPTPPNPQSAGR